MDETTPPQRPQFAPAPTGTAEPASQESDAPTLKERAIAAICEVFDPEIPVNIYELGLIYSVDTTPENDINIAMTLTSPMCPVAESLPIDVEMRVRCVEGANNVHVELTWDPPWEPGMMSEAAKLELGFM